MNTQSVFVYGSLLSGFLSPAYEYISQFFDLVGPATVKGTLYDLGEYPAAVPSEGDRVIKGELYTIKNPAEFSWAIGQLDDYEGVVPDDGEQPLYRRELVEVIINHQPVSAWIYWYNRDISGKPILEAGNVIEYFHNKRES